MVAQQKQVIFTITDEAPALATRSLLPIVRAFAKKAGVDVATKDISLAGRILAQFSDCLEPAQQFGDDLAFLGDLAKSPQANIIKLPNISASVPQLLAAIRELQAKGFKVPDFVQEPATDLQKEHKQRYLKVLGSAVNPVLREGNSDRRVALPVKNYAKTNPHSMGAWSSDSKTHVAHMQRGDFYASEKSYVSPNEQVLRIELVEVGGKTTILKEALKISEGEVIDASFLSLRELRSYFAEEMLAAKKDGLLLSLHLKATMMKVSDPIMFGQAVEVYFDEIFDRHRATLRDLGVKSSNGWGDVLEKIKTLPEQQRLQIEKDIAANAQKRPELAMVNSDKGITNLHVPSDVIIDASMPAAIRASGKMWNSRGQLHDTKALIPDRCYAGIYQEAIDFCKKNGAFDPKTMGSVANVGLMAQKAEEYGSHDKTFQIPVRGVVKVLNSANQTIFEHAVEEGDIWRMCQTKDLAIRDWVQLAVRRARASKTPAVFWLDEKRPHDAQLIQKVESYLKVCDTAGLDISIKNPIQAMRYSLERAKKGLDTISVTGNVLRDYLTDLFPILELGTSAKMLSIVPLLSGGGLFETGAGGSAPKLVEQFLEEGHLRWDSLGEFLALAVSFEDLAEKTRDPQVAILAATLNSATEKLLAENRSPSRKVGEIDNRGSHFYLAWFWADALARQAESVSLANVFAPLSHSLGQNAQKIVAELRAAAGKSVDIGGYYYPNERLANAAMRPSQTLNYLIDNF